MMVLEIASENVFLICKRWCKTVRSGVIWKDWMTIQCSLPISKEMWGTLVKLVDLKQKDVGFLSFVPPMHSHNVNFLLLWTLKTLDTFTGRQNKLTEKNFCWTHNYIWPSKCRDMTDEVEQHWRKPCVLLLLLSCSPGIQPCLPLESGL